MCCDLLLSKTNNGKVCLSANWDHYVIIYKNVVMLQDSLNMEKIFQQVRSCQDSFFCDEHTEEQTYVFRTQTQNIMLQFNQEEIKEMNYLLETALLETMKLDSSELVDA